MNKLEINLLPPELNVSKQESLKKKLVFRTGVIFLSITILATVGIFIVVISRTLALKNNQDNLESAKSQVAGLKEQESLAVVLKDRLSGISTLLSQESPEVEAYDLITTLMPQNVTLLSLSVDRNSKLQLSGETSNTTLLDEFFNKLTDPQSHEGKITGATINNLNVSSGSRIKFDLTISLAQK